MPYASEQIRSAEHLDPTPGIGRAQRASSHRMRLIRALVDPLNRGWLPGGRGGGSARAGRAEPSNQHAIAAKEDLLLGPLGHAPLDRRRGQVELVVQRLLHQIQERPLDGAEDHLLEGRVT